MKVKDFDYRIWDNDQKKYLKYEGFGWEDYSRKKDYYIGKDSEGKLVIATCLVCCDDVDFYHLDNHKNYEEYEIELWTGYKDSKGNKIYEGDIVALRSEDKEIIGKITIHKNGNFYFANKDGVFLCDLIARLRGELIDFDEIKVIGNIHKNTDLLESREFESKKLNCESCCSSENLTNTSNYLENKPNKNTLIAETNHTKMEKI